MESLSLGERLAVDHLGSCIWVNLVSSIHFLYAFLCYELLVLSYVVLLSYMGFICISGVNVQTGEEVAAKLVSIEFLIVVLIFTSNFCCTLFYLCFG